MPASTIRERVIEKLEAAGVPYRLILHEPAVGSLRIAEKRGMPASAGAKALVVRAAGRFLLLVIPGNRRLSSVKLRRALGTHDIRFARAAELFNLTGCRPGEVPPLGELFGLAVIMDDRLTRETELAFTAGSTSESFAVRSQDLVTLARPQIADLCDEADADDAEGRQSASS